MDNNNDNNNNNNNNNNKINNNENNNNNNDILFTIKNTVCYIIQINVSEIIRIKCWVSFQDQWENTTLQPL